MMNNAPVYYFITVFERLDISENGWPDTGASRCWGFYKDKEIAYQAVHENWTDLEETVYEYALIEGYYEGISHFSGFKQYFKFDRDKGGYVDIEEPDGYKHFIVGRFG